MIKLSYRTFDLLLKHPFTIAEHTRNSTPVVLLKLRYQEYTGCGEASMVPYLGESIETATGFLTKVDFSKITYPFDFGETTAYLDSLAAGNTAIKAAVEIALHDLQGKIENKPCYSYFNVNPAFMPVTSFTIGIDKPEIIRQKVKEAEVCKVLKVKLGSGSDKELINTIREVTDKPLYVDANQGWPDINFAIEMTFWLREKGVELIEQPMNKNDIEANAKITEQSALPIIADEAVQRLNDITKIKGAYHGINVKLMKSTGMFEAHEMIKKARELGLKVLMGCMSETSCATLAAAALAPLCDWVDLDGPFLTKNNPFKNPEFKEGRYILSETPGLGLEEL